MESKTCCSCRYYRQHYILNDRKILRIYCGHCTDIARKPHKTKIKHPDAKACENYVEAESDTSRFVSKEYLSKALLEYITKLDLLPEIRNAEENP